MPRKNLSKGFFCYFKRMHNEIYATKYAHVVNLSNYNPAKNIQKFNWLFCKCTKQNKCVFGAKINKINCAKKIDFAIKIYFSIIRENAKS